MSDTSTEAVQVGGGYVEDPDFVPDPTDHHGTLNTSGIGAHQDPAVISPMFEVDKKATAAQIKAALDPEDTSVDSSKVLLTTPQTVVAVDHDDEKASLLKRAEAELADPVVIGGTGEEGTDAEKEAAESGPEGEQAAKEQEADTSGQTSSTAGSHETPADKADEQKDAEAKPEAKKATKPKP
jgi:hypothetical protein